MEELTYEEQLKLANSREHLKIVLGNIRIANETLTQLYNQISSSQKLLVQSVKDRDAVIESSSKISIDILEKTANQNKREEYLLERENELKKIEEEYGNKFFQYEKELKDKKIEIASIKSESNKLVNLYSNILNDIQNQIDRLNIELKSIDEEYKEKLSYKKNIEDEIFKLNSEKEEAEKKLNKFIIESKFTIEATNKLIEEEKNKVSKPREALRLETEKLETFRTDLLIIKNRLREQFEKQNPKKIVPIELKEK